MMCSDSAGAAGHPASTLTGGRPGAVAFPPRASRIVADAGEPEMNASQLSQDQIADRLEKAADLLEAPEPDRFRVRTYQRGAETMRALDRDPVVNSSSERRSGP
jgi:hypothetical protein